MVTIKEIAKLLNLSTTTVSNVIHGKTKEVSKETVQKVEKLLKELEYIPNINARNLAQNKSRIIAVTVLVKKEKYSNIFSDPFFGEILGAIERYIRKNGYFMMVYIANNVRELLGYVSSWNVDGLIICGARVDDYLQISSKYSKPIVLIDSYLPKELTKYVNIGLEDTKGSFEMTKYLIDNGHKNILFYCDNLEGVDYYRFKGFEEALKENNIESAEDNLFMLSLNNDNEDNKRLLNKLKKYTAIFCTSDLYAIKLINLLRENHIKVPKDISVVGFDDCKFRQIAYPTLTTVHQDVEKKGQIAVRYLIKMIEGQKVPKDTKLKTKMIIGKSVKKIS